MTASAYARLERLFSRLSHIEDSLSILHWDMSTMMPEGGAESRANQLATLRGIAHEMITAPEVEDLLGAAEGESLDDWQRANLSEMKREWVHAAAVPADLVEATTKANSACEMVWRKARPASDFKAVAPLLEEVLRLTREVAQVKSERLGRSLYDSLLDQYEPGGSSAAIDLIFADLEVFLPDFLGRVLDKQGAAPSLPQGPFPVDKQRQLGVEVMTALGFDFDRGRLDVSQHPFCGGTADDVRLTTRYREDIFAPSLMGIIHETGHALYELGLPKDWRGQPVGRARGMSLHESQSLLMEMQACRSKAFLSWVGPKIAQTFGGTGPEWSVEALYAHSTRVERGFIRVDADEVTYPAHVILRYRLEKALVEDRMQIADLPAAWNEGMGKLLGITPPDDRHGCLQDIHWFDGAFGYFPTYTLGAMTAAQLFDAAKRANPDIEPAISRGDFAPLLAWLREHVHGKASSRSADQLLTEATGKPLDAGVFKRHLEARYLAA